jgi:transcriptional regulator with XRE-family HTH domain
MERVGKNLRGLRNSKGYTLRHVAEQLGIDYSYLSKVEKGQPASLDLLQKLADFYKVDISYFFTEIPDELKEIGVEWIEFSKEMQEKNISPEEMKDLAKLTPEQVKQIIALVKSING